jgi:hypothetical protein
MAHYTRPLNAELDLVVAYTSTGESVIHAKGCSHTKGSRVIREARNFTYDEANKYNDDWYFVAPCAANGKGRICTKYGPSCSC